jgi:hypothetical protein
MIQCGCRQPLAGICIEAQHTAEDGQYLGKVSSSCAPEKLRGVKGPGLFLIIPVIDHVVAVIDERIQTTAFSAEQALTKIPSR